MKRLALLASVVIALLAAAPAQAHHFSNYHAETIWYSNYAWRCGDGSWICGNKLVSLQCWTTSGTAHRKTCRYQFAEHKFGGYDRYCTVSGELYHYDVWSWREDC